MMLRRTLPGAAALLLLALPSGCGAAAEKRPVAQDSIASPAPEPAGDWTAEGLEAQPRMAALQEEAPGQTGYVPGTTPWRPAGGALPVAAPPPGVAATPGAYLGWLAQERGWHELIGDAAWEETLRILPRGEDAATGVVLQWGMKDDAVAGRDMRVRLRLKGGAWHAESVEERFHCRRRLGPDGQCA
jgi:hypothetical protein